MRYENKIIGREFIMKNHLRKVAMLLAVVTVVGLPAGNVLAANKPFSNYKFTTSPNTESYKAIVSKAKSDYEQNWYATITSSKNLGTQGDPRAILTSATNWRAASSSSSKLGLYKNMSGVQKKSYPSSIYLKKGTTCTLYVTGNSNISKKYTITLSGKYTS